MLSAYFSSIFTADNHSLPPHQQNVTPLTLDLMFTPNIVLRKLIKLNTKSAGGYDDVPPIFLKQCAHVLSHSLAFLLEHSFNSSVLPAIWLHAYITPIFKNGDSTSSANYRPISLHGQHVKLWNQLSKMP